MIRGGVYIHFPFCTSKCTYCDFYTLTNQEANIDDFITYLCKEIELTAKENKLNWKIDTLFIGGGTPSLISTNQLNKIYDTLNKSFNLSCLNEFTIEANPGEFSIDKMKQFKSIGINRISLGFQSLNDTILQSLSRWHLAKDCIESYNNARKAGFENINVDMIFGIPNQTLQQWEKDLNTIIDLDPEHISAYSLIVEEKTPLYSQVNSGEIVMPHEKTEIRMYSYTMDVLNQDNYLQYEISSYSKENKKCNHNLHYWRREPYLAFGPSAHGFNNEKRYWNIRDLNEYIKKLSKNKLPIENFEILGKESIFNELILNGLRTSDGLNLEYIQNNFNNQIFKSLSRKIKEWGNHLERNDTNIKLSKEGYFIADEITLDFINSYC